MSCCLGASGLWNLSEAYFCCWDRLLGLGTLDPVTGLAFDVNPAVGGVFDGHAGVEVLAPVAGWLAAQRRWVGLQQPA